METFETKPTYQEQLAWLDLVGMMAQPSDKEMIKAIKENVIAVNNYEKALDDELRPAFKRDIDQVFKDLLAYGEARTPMVVEIQTFDSESAELNQALDNIHTSWMKLNQQLDYVEQQRPEVPFVFRADELNPREELIIDNRLKQLQGELRFELSRKKQFRSQQAIDHCHTSINNLKKWKSNG